MTECKGIVDCSGGNLTGAQCPDKAVWRNRNGVKVCEHHRLLLDAFTWEGRNEREWVEIAEQ